MMKMYMYLDAHRLDFFSAFFFRRFSFPAYASLQTGSQTGVRFQVSEEAEVVVYPYIKRQMNRVARITLRI